MCIRDRLSVWLGLSGSLEFDTPAGPSIVVAALSFFIFSILPLPKLKSRNQFQKIEPAKAELDTEIP